jgi:hypothetical protein
MAKHLGMRKPTVRKPKHINIHKAKRSTRKPRRASILRAGRIV